MRELADGEGRDARRSSRWRGCWRRATTSSRSPARSGAAYLEENVAALDVELTEDDMRALDEAVPAGAAAGERYPDMSSIDV